MSEYGELKTNEETESFDIENDSLEKSIQEKNRFKEMGFIKFWFFSTLFFLTFQPH